MNGVVNGTMEEPIELTLSATSKSKKPDTEDCFSTNINNHVNDNSENNQVKKDTNYSKTNDNENISDKLCGEKIPNTENNICPKENSIDIAKISAKEHQENSEGQCAEVLVSSNSKIINGNCDDDHIQLPESNVTDNKLNLSEKLLKERNQNGGIKGASSPEVEEIVSDNDECEPESNVKTSLTENKVQLRRSNRAIKRKRYDDEENSGDISDVEVVAVDLLRRKPKPIVINDTKTLVEMAAKQIKVSQARCQKKEPTVVIIDTNSVASCKPVPIKNSINSNSAISAQNLYQSIIARGTSVTPVSSKTNSTAQRSSSGSPQPTCNQNILPSLTDDMFVVEAPSFIVPYVYEKPSIKPFREFVDLLGKDLELMTLEVKNDENSNETKEFLGEKEELENKDLNEDKKVEQSDTKGEIVKKKNEDGKRAERKSRRNDDDDASWDGESSTESDDEIGSDDDEDKTVVIKVKTSSNENLKSVTGLTIEKVIAGKTDSYFDCSLGNFFIDIGINLVQEFVQNDLLKQQNRKLYREKKGGHNTRATESSIASLTKNLEFSKEKNAPYRLKQNKCSFCSFKSESDLVMAHHLETPHMKNNVYKCNYCTFEIKSPHDILHHMEAEHNVRGRLERALAYHQCANCPFEDNGKGKLARHLIPCSKKFKPELNLAPPIEWEPPAKIPKITRSKNSMMGTYPSAFHRSTMNSSIRAATVPGSANATVPSSGGCVNVGGAFRLRGRSPLPTASRSAPLHGSPMIRGGVMLRHNTSALLPTPFPVTSNCKNVGTIRSSSHQPSISITPLPRQPQPTQPQPAHQSKNTFVICEICDGYIKDLEQLRNHMHWIHKVKIHPKMIYNRPPLNCQKCQCRFFTDQGLERHLLGSHGLVTSSMQEAANKGKDAGRCPVCGRVYQWKLLNHVTRDHNLVLKPAHLSYKCTVCTATFGMYKQFENHVYSAHSVVAKRVMDKSKITPNKSNDSMLKPLKINDEITITPQPVKPATPVKDK